MKIHLDLEISSQVYNDEQMEKLRMELRKQLVGFIFRVVDGTTTPGGATMEHVGIVIDGQIKPVY